MVDQRQLTVGKGMLLGRPRKTTLARAEHDHLRTRSQGLVRVVGIMVAKTMRLCMPNLGRYFLLKMDIQGVLREMIKMQSRGRSRQWKQKHGKAEHQGSDGRYAPRDSHNTTTLFHV